MGAPADGGGGVARVTLGVRALRTDGAWGGDGHCVDQVLLMVLLVFTKDIFSDAMFAVSVAMETKMFTNVFPAQEPFM